MLAATPPLPPSSPLPPPEESSTPAAQLVTELFQSLKAKSSPEQEQQQEEGEKVSPHGLKAKSSPMEQPDPSPFQQPNITPVFKPPLKKVRSILNCILHIFFSSGGAWPSCKSLVGPKSATSKLQVTAEEDEQQRPLCSARRPRRACRCRFQVGSPKS